MIRLYLYTIRKIVKFSCVRASETRVRPRSRRWPVGREGQRRIELRWKPDFASRSVHEPSSPDYVGKNRRKMPKRYSPPVFRSFEPASTPLRMRDILSVWWTSGLNIDVILCHTNFWDFYEKYFGCTRFVRDSEISWFILLDI